MRKSAHKAVATIVAALFVLALVPPFSIRVTSWQRRREASRLLSIAKRLRPGITTEAEARKTLAPFNRYLSHGWESISVRPDAARDSYYISNYPDWVSNAGPRLPDWVNSRIWLWILPYASFSVSPRYRSSELVLLELRQEEFLPSGEAHAAEVRVLSTRTEQGEPEFPGDFSGFYVSPKEETIFDENGKKVGSSRIGREFVTLDDRASPEQLGQAFNFQLSCFTSLLGCRDARKILAIAQ